MTDEVPKLEIIRGDGRLDENQDILKPLLHLISAPRKDIVRKIIPAFNYWLKAPAEVVEKVHYITELMAESLHMYGHLAFFIIRDELLYLWNMSQLVLGNPQN